MKLYRIEDTHQGWFIGDFEKAAFQTNNFEACWRIHKKDEKWDTHYHKHITEINLLVSGTMFLQNKKLVSGDIFILYPYEIADPIFITDCEIVCIKVPGIVNDKVVIKTND